MQRQNVLFCCSTRSTYPDFSSTPFSRSYARLLCLQGDDAGFTIDRRVFYQNTKGLPAVYNEVLDACAASPAEQRPIVVLIHDDLSIDDLFFFDKLHLHIKQHPVLGVAGSGRFDVFGPPLSWMQPQHRQQHAGCVFHESLGGVPTVYGPPGPVTVLDGCLIAIDTAHPAAGRLRFCPDYTWHLYDLDFSVEAQLHGVPMAVVDWRVTHRSGGESAASPAWAEDAQRYRRKWEKRKIPTPRPTPAVVAAIQEPLADYKHSGNVGDILYSLPYIKAAGGGSLVLTIGAPGDYSGAGAQHPDGSVQLSDASARWIKPLLDVQPYIRGISIGHHGYTKARVDIDDFRKHRTDFQYTPISLFCAPVFSVDPDLTQPSLEGVGLYPGVKEPYCVVNRTFRYRNPRFSYMFLRGLGIPIVFVGLRDEYDDFLTHCPTARYVECLSALVMARVIRSSRMFIGNQSCAAAIAELLKVRRFVELAPQCPNNIPFGPGGFATQNFLDFVRMIKQGVAT